MEIVENALSNTAADEANLEAQLLAASEEATAARDKAEGRRAEAFRAREAADAAREAAEVKLEEAEARLAERSAAAPAGRRHSPPPAAAGVRRHGPGGLIRHVDLHELYVLHVDPKGHPSTAERSRSLLPRPSLPAGR